MNPLDIIIISAMLFLIVRGIFRGFFREIGSLAGVILGIWLANLYQPQVTEYLKTYLPSGRFLPLVGFGVIFAFVVVLCNLAGRALKAILKKAFFGCVDRFLGACLAILKGIIIIYFAIILITFFLPSKTPVIAKSRLSPLIISSYQSMVSIISPGSYENLKRKFLGKKEEMDHVVSKKIGGVTK